MDKSASMSQLQGLDMPEERVRRAAETAHGIQDTIAGAAREQLGFDDGPFDYFAWFARESRRAPR